MSPGRVGDEFDFEAVGVGEVGGVVVPASGVRMCLREQQRPAVGWSRCGEGIDAGPAPCVERKMVHPGAEPVVVAGAQGGRLLDDEVGSAEQPAPAVFPVLKLHVAQFVEQPSPLLTGAGQVGHPQFDMMQVPPQGMTHAGRIRGPGGCAAAERRARLGLS
jgi:hypothetical protein